MFLFPDTLWILFLFSWNFFREIISTFYHLPNVLFAGSDLWMVNATIKTWESYWSKKCHDNEKQHSDWLTKIGCHGIDMPASWLAEFSGHCWTCRCYFLAIRESKHIHQVIPSTETPCKQQFLLYMYRLKFICSLIFTLLECHLNIGFNMTLNY